MQESCLSCHNGHPASTKRDWVVNDIRGIQEVSVGSIKSRPFDYSYLFGYFLMLMTLAAGSILVFRNSANTLRSSNQMLEQARQAEQDATVKLKEQLQQLTILGAVADKSTFGVSIADCHQADMPLIYVNDAFCDLTGLTKEDSIGKNCRFLSGLKTDPETRALLRHAIQAGLPQTVEILNYKKDGTEFWNRLTIFPVGGVTGQPDYYVGYQVDVTELRMAQEERDVMMAEIQEGQKLESLGLLVAGISHEINNPLGIALTAASHMSQSAQDLRKNLESQSLLHPSIIEFLEDEKQAYALIEDNLNRAASLVRSFKEVASDRAQDSVREVNLESYLDTLVGSFLPLMKRTRTTITVKAQENLMVLLDTGAFGQLLTNLVVNAVTHAFKETVNPTIEVEAVKQGDLIKLTVCDNGCGISAPVMAHLFDPFYTTQRYTGGTGLGLFIARRIAVETFNGDLSVSNQPNGGACFCLTFPFKGNE
jgi:PAS domain S-box-containing protein